jgi:hypothetical protein
LLAHQELAITFINTEVVCEDEEGIHLVPGCPVGAQVIVLHARVQVCNVVGKLSEGVLAWQGECTRELIDETGARAI